MEKVKYSDLIGLIAEETGETKVKTKEVVETLFELIEEVIVADKAITIPRFGTFKPSYTKARTGVNPRNPEEKIDIPAKKGMRIKVSGVLKENLNR